MSKPISETATLRHAVLLVALGAVAGGCTLQTAATGSDAGGDAAIIRTMTPGDAEAGAPSPDADAAAEHADPPSTTPDGAANLEAGEAAIDAAGDAGAEGGLADVRPAICLAVLQCIGACPDADNACPDNCNNLAPPQTQADVLALAQCLNDNVCSDAACANQNCAAPLAACALDSKGPQGQPFDGGAPTGSVPEALVGSFSGTEFGVTEAFVFNADGTATDTYTSTAGDFGCTITESVVNSGTVVFTGTTFTLYAANRMATDSMCGMNTMVPESAATIVFDYTYDAANDELDVVEEQSPSCDYADLGSRQEYCGYRLKRQ